MSRHALNRVGCAAPRRRATIILGALLATAAGTHAQELDPRTYSPAPVGTKISVGGFGRSRGAIVLDPSVGIQDAEADLWFSVGGFGYVFGLGGRQARVLATFPMARGEVSGVLGGSVQSQRLSGPTDPRVKFSVGLRGLPARSIEQIAGAPRTAIVGASLSIVAPIGRYDRARLVNLGYHRWAFKPELGVSLPVGGITLECDAGAWLYTTNRAYFPGDARRRQDPLLSLQAHVSGSPRDRVWVALDGTWFSGGATHVDGALSPDRQDNVRLGATLSVPITGPHTAKFVYSLGTTTRRGTDYDTFAVLWQLVSLPRARRS